MASIVVGLALVALPHVCSNVHHGMMVVVLDRRNHGHGDGDDDGRLANAKHQRKRHR